MKQFTDNSIPTAFSSNSRRQKRREDKKKKKTWLPLPYAYISTMYHVSVETVVMFPIILSIRNIVRERYLLPENVPKYSVLSKKSVEKSKE